jgi:hypothetical protein
MEQIERRGGGQNGRKPRPTSRRLVRVQARLDPELYEMLNRLADKRGQSISAVIADVLSSEDLQAELAS